MREVNLIVIHCSATRCNVPFTVETLERSHRQRGFCGIGYHFYIARNGHTYHTRPTETIGAHAQGFNHHSIGICYEGGLNEQGKPADTRTRWQKDSLADLIQALHATYPQAEVKGHYQLSTDVHKACPCFDAKKEYGFLLSL